jgi:hypothetical protein
MDYRKQVALRKLEEQAKKDRISKLQDLLMSISANFVGAPVDMWNMSTKFGDPYNTTDNSNIEVDVMSSDWIKKKMKEASLKSDREYPVEELLSSLVTPDPTDMVVASKLLPSAASVFIPRKWSSEKGQEYVKDLKSGQYTREEMWAKHRMDHQLTPGRLVEEVPTDTVDFLPSSYGTGNKPEKSNFKDSKRGNHSLYYSLPGLEDIEGIPPDLVQRIKDVTHLQETNLNYNGSFNPSSDALRTNATPAYLNPTTDAEKHANKDWHAKALNHELQHVISDYYRMARGGNPEEFKSDKVKKLQSELEDLAFRHELELDRALADGKKLQTFKHNIINLGARPPSNREEFLNYLNGISLANVALKHSNDEEATKALKESGVYISRELKKDPDKLKKLLEDVLADDEMFISYLEPQLKLRKAGAMSSKFDKKAIKEYRSLSDEQLANIAAERRYMTDEEIRAEPPWTSDQHIPLDKQIVKFKK